MHECECAVLQKEAEILASSVGEILLNPNASFYDYDTKYINDNAKTTTQANIAKKAKAKIQHLSKKVFEVLGCKDLARIDFFVQGDNITVNEINTMPGFTSISMYPQLWEKDGISQTELLEILIKNNAKEQQ